MNKIYIKKTLSFFSLLAISSLSGLFGSSIEDEPSLRTIPIIEIPGDSMPGWEKQIIELYHDEEGNPLPVVFRGAAKNWEAATWTPEYFAEHFGDIEIQVISQNVLESLEENSEDIAAIVPEENLICKADETPLRICDKDGLNCHEECFICDEIKLHCYKSKEETSESRINPIDTTIKDHISDILLNPKNAGYLLCGSQHNETKETINAKLESDSEELIKNTIFAHNYLNLETKTQFPQSIAGTSENGPRAYVLFIGSENSITTLHNHPSTFLAQIYGKKIARLIHPKDIEKCSCLPKDIEKCSCLPEPESVVSCAIEITAPDFEKYPEIKNLEVFQTILQPGDVLYIPPFWLHDIRGLSTSISISSGF